VPRAVRLTAYGGIDELRIVDVPKPEPQAGDVVVRVVAAGTNPGEISIREGYLKAMFPMDFPFGQGADFAGYVDSVGAGVTTFARGDEVLGWTDRRGAQAEYVATEAAHLIAKPPMLDWYRAGSLFVVATTAVAAVRAVALKPGDVVAISGAAGGVGSLATQLARQSGARVIGIASEANGAFLRSLGAEALTYGDGMAERLRAVAPTSSEAATSISQSSSASHRNASTRSSTSRAHRNMARKPRVPPKQPRRKRSPPSPTQSLGENSCCRSRRSIRSPSYATLMRNLQNVSHAVKSCWRSIRRSRSRCDPRKGRRAAPRVRCPIVGN
jgi:D-arabinose 1-dehydrogenase-like Zn-dependent alcohol dehydrogenase